MKHERVARRGNCPPSIWKRRERSRRKRQERDARELYKIPRAAQVASGSTRSVAKGELRNQGSVTWMLQRAEASTRLPGSRGCGQRSVDEAKSRCSPCSRYSKSMAVGPETCQVGSEMGGSMAIQLSGIIPLSQKHYSLPWRENACATSASDNS